MTSDVERVRAAAKQAVEVRYGRGEHAAHSRMFMSPHWIVCSCKARAVASGNQIARYMDRKEKVIPA